MTSHAAQLHDFLIGAGWGRAARTHLAGDASDRSYLRLTMNGKTAVLMDAPVGQGDDPAQFLRMSAHLASIGLSPPQCLAQDLDHGFLLLEDLGDGLFARILMQNPEQELPLYRLAVDTLITIHNHPAPTGLPNQSAAQWADAAMLAVTRYRTAIAGDMADAQPLCAALSDALHTHADGPRVLVLRDYHAENLLFLPNRVGVKKVGLLDFQLGQMGQPAYDLVSLLQDARRDVQPQTEAALQRHFCDATGQSDTQFRAAYAALGVQRALRILGVFAQLCLVGGKANYLALMPRVYAQLQRNLDHPDLTAVANLCEKIIPEPTPSAIAKIGSQCGNFR